MTNLYNTTASGRITTAFSKVIDRAALTERDHRLFDTHYRSVSNALASRLPTVKAELIGSVARGSAIHQSSDADALLVVEKRWATRAGGLKSSTTVLAEIRSALVDRYPYTEVGKDGQAVVVDFQDEHPVDVVPAVYERNDGLYNYPVYLIPDGSGEWMETSPGSHNRYISDMDRRAGGKLKYCAQIFKFWRNTRSVPVPISGFHVELLLGAEALCEGARPYALMFHDLLVELSNRGCSALQDPVAISGLISAAPSTSKRANALRTVTEAARHAADASAALQRTGAHKKSYVNKYLDSIHVR
jgi:hypothetical protein